MKKVFGLIAIVTVIAFVFIACEGPTGPAGKKGDDGDPGTQGPQGDPGKDAGHIHSYDNGICSECYSIVMVQIKGGNFSMGQTGFATPVRTVTLSSFKMSKYAVTQELYEAVTGVNPSNFKGANLPDAGEVQSKRPVETVTWFGAVEFCNKLSIIEGFSTVYTINIR